MTAKRKMVPPAEVWVAWCGRCGSPIIADGDKRKAETAVCGTCPGTLTLPVGVAQYVLARRRRRKVSK